jgi:hypothetical protein
MDLSIRFITLNRVQRRPFLFLRVNAISLVAALPVFLCFFVGGVPYIHTCAIRAAIRTARTLKAKTAFADIYSQNPPTSKN